MRFEGLRTNSLSVCPFCACGCGLYWQSTDGQVAGVMPSEHHPVSRGRLCARGWAAHEASFWGPRLTRPLIRRGGRLEPATWPDALAAAAERIQRVQTAAQPLGVVGSGRATNEENFLVVRLARHVLRTNHVDSCLRAPYQALAAGLRGTGSGSHVPSTIADLERCDVILLVEGDLARTHPRAAFAVMKALRSGGRLVTMGPRRTQMSRLAWLHLPLVPGDEPVLAARLAVAAAAGTPAGRAQPGQAGSLTHHVPPADAHLMPSAEFRRAVEAYAAADRAAVVLAPTGATASSLHAVADAFAKLAAVTGHQGRPGSALLALPIRSNSCGALEMGVSPNCLPGLCALDDEPARRRLRQIWGSDLACRRGLDLEVMVGGIRGLVVVADEPGIALSSGDRYRTQLATLDCLIALDAFVTPTVRAAHVALPIASPAETDGTYTNMEGRIQRLGPGVSPAGEVRPGWWVLSELASALGAARAPSSLAEVRQEIGAAVPSYADAMAGRAEVRTPAGAGGDGTVEPEHAVEATLVRVDPRSDQTGRAARAPFRLLIDGVVDWGGDPLVDASPTLCRDHRSRHKLFPDGVIDMSARDAERLGIRHGWRVKLTSVHGEVVVPVNLTEDLEPGILTVPFAFRDRLQGVLGRDALTGVNLERVQ